MWMVGLSVVVAVAVVDRALFVRQEAFPPKILNGF